MLKSSVRHMTLNGWVGSMTYFNIRGLHKSDLLPTIHPETSAAQAISKHPARCSGHVLKPYEQGSESVSWGQEL